MMKTQELSIKLKEIQEFFHVLQIQYAEAFHQDDVIGMIETSGELCRSFASLGNIPLARKWAEEYQTNLCRARKQM